MLLLLSGLALRPLENWPQIQTKADSRALFAVEASFCAVSKHAGTPDKLLKQDDFALHDPDP
jgi:hypothetical protein